MGLPVHPDTGAWHATEHTDQYANTSTGPASRVASSRPTKCQLISLSLNPETLAKSRPVACEETELVVDRGCRDQGVRQSDSGLSMKTTCSLGHRATNRKLPERGEKNGHKLGGGVPGEQFGPCDN